MIELNKDNYKENINDGICIIDFWSPSCHPCMFLKPQIENLESKYNNIKFYSVDTSKNKRIAMEYKVMSLPTILIFNNSSEIRRFVRDVSIEKLESFIEQKFIK